MNKLKRPVVKSFLYLDNTPILKVYTVQNKFLPSNQPTNRQTNQPRQRCIAGEGF